MKDLRFPRVRTVLWDRSNQGPPIHVHVSSFRKPQVCVLVSGLHVIKQHAASSLDSQRITLYANVVYDKNGQRVSIMVDTADEAKGSDENKVMPIQVPILISKSKKCVFPPEDYTNAVKNVFVHCGNSDPVELNSFFSVLGKCFVQKSDGGLLETCFEFDVVTAVTQIKVVPINSVPIMLTALSKDLASPMGWSNLHGQSRSGYITMDHARKLVLMVDSDPKIFTLPLIGIWVSGVESVCHPFVWAGCLRYLCNSNLQQRVCLPPSPFILVLYSRLQTRPEFYECSPLNADVKLHQMEIYSGFKPVQLGYKQDSLTVELNLLKYGMKKDKIDGAASRMVKAPGNKPEPVSSSDEMMPRSIPTPHQSKIPEAKFDVPEVSIIFSDSGHHPSQTGSLTVSCPSLTATNFQHPPTLATPAYCNSYTRMQNSAVVSTTSSATYQLMQQGNRSLPPGYPGSQNPQLKGYNGQPSPHPPLAVSNPEYIQPRGHLLQAPYPPHHNLPSPSNMYVDHHTPPISGPYPRYSPYPPAIYSSVPSQITTQGHYNNKNTSPQHQNPLFNSAHLVPVPCEGYPMVKSHVVPQPVRPVPPGARHPVRPDVPRFPYCPNQSNPIGSVARPPYPSTTIHPHASFQPQANGYLIQSQNQNLVNQNNSARPQMDNAYYYRPPYCATSHALASKPCLTTDSTPIYSPENTPASNIYRTNLGDSVDKRPSEGSPEDMNSCRASRDSGLSDSPDSGQDSEVQLSKIQWENVPVEIYNLLMQQSAQLRDLKAQVQQMKLSQTFKSVSDPTSQSTISTSVGTSLCDDTPKSLQSDKTCTIAVNTSFQYQAESPSPVERAATLTVSLQTSPERFLPSQSEQDSPVRDSSQEKITSLAKSTESRQWQSSQNQNGSFTATMPDMSHEDLSAVVRRLSVDQKSMDSFQSEMVVDIPSYQTSLFRSTESANTDRLPSLSSSHSLVSASMCANIHHHTDSERDTDDDDDDDDGDISHSDPQVLTNKPECYDRLINNVKQLLQREDPEENVLIQDTQPYVAKGSASYEDYLANGTSRIGDDSLLFADESFHRYELNLVDCTFVPKINYTSMLLDSDTETSLEINSLALKYLNDDQLTQMAKLHKQGASSTRPLCQNVFLRQIMRNNPDTSGTDISKYGMCVNNLTFATRKYMEKHHLIETDFKNDQRVIQDSTDTNSPLHESEQDGSYPNIFGNMLSPSSSPPLECHNNKDRPRVIGPLAGAAGTVLPCNRFEPLSKSTPVFKPFPKIDSSPMENVFGPFQSPRNEEPETDNNILDIAKLKQLPKLL